MTRRVSAAGMMLEVTPTTPERRVFGIAFMVEVVPGGTPPETPTGIICAPVVDSTHAPVAAAENAGPELLALMGTAEVSAEDNAGPTLSGLIQTLQAAAADNAGPMILADLAQAVVVAAENAGPTVLAAMAQAEAASSDNSGPTILAILAQALAPSTANSGPTVAAGMPERLASSTANSGPTVMALILASLAAPSSDNAGPTVSGAGEIPTVTAASNNGPTVSGAMLPIAVTSSDNTGPTVSGAGETPTVAAVDNSGATVSGAMLPVAVSAEDNAGPTVFGAGEIPTVAAADNSGATVQGQTGQTPVDAIGNSGPLSLAAEVDSGHIPAPATPQVQTPVRTYFPGHYSPQGITIEVYRPTIAPAAYSPEALAIKKLDNVTSGWSHTIGIDGGFASAQLTINDSRPELDDWLENGLNRHIVAYSEAQERVWEGFVNSVELRIGPLTWTRGPVMDVANRVLVQYSPLNVDIDPPTTGTPTETELAENTDSQLAHGILETVLSGGTVSRADAEQYRDIYLYEAGWPQQSKDISIGSGSQASVTLNLLGYGAFLSRFIYTNTGINYITATNKIKAVLQADPNAFWYDLTYIGENLYIVPELVENRQTTGISVINGIKELGDANDLPWTFGVYAFRRPIYAAQETEYSYYQRLGDPMQRIYDAAGGWVRPWNVKPGKWLFIEDVMVGYPRAGNPRAEPRALYIEEVTYTAPWGLQLRGSGGGGRLKQYLAKLSLGGRG